MPSRNQSIITRTEDGEYSTVQLPDGTIETMFFGDDGEQRIVGRSSGIWRIHREHIERDEWGCA